MANHKQYLALTIVILLMFSIVAIANLKGSFAQSSTTGRGECGPMDVTFAVDDTGSMGGAIDNVKSELPAIIAQANSASGGDLRLGLVTFEDDVNVLHELTFGIPLVTGSINSIVASGGAGLPEASDIAKDTTVNNLDGFNEPWRNNAVKILILITDAPPGGLNDFKDPEDVTRMHDVALSANTKGILVSDVFVPTAGDYDGQKAILQDDAATSGGAFIETASDGKGTATAIKDIIKNCGKPFEPDCKQENIQHWDKIIFKINSTEFAKRVGLPNDSELDIQVLDNPKEVADIKKKVFTFLGFPNDIKRELIQIVDVDYAIVCAEFSPTGEGTVSLSSDVKPSTFTSSSSNSTSLSTLSGMDKMSLMDRALTMQTENKSTTDRFLSQNTTANQ